LEEALLELDQSRPGAVITDLRMPLVDGFGLLYRIRSREAQQHISVVTGDTTLSKDMLSELSDLGARYGTNPLRPLNFLPRREPSV
jgi:DNA-binding response OmpR family regulator